MIINKKNLKRASLELSVNFIVVAIISLVLIGIGMALLVRGKGAVETQQGKISEIHKQNIIDAMSNSGVPVSIYPNVATVSRGEYADFTIGINNELQRDGDFSLNVVSATPGVQDDNNLLYTRDKISLKNGESTFSPIRIITSKSLGKTSYIYNVCVYKGEFGSSRDCSNSESKYGTTQKIIVNVK